jgi:ArsR family transcriptional regulator, arsenate/arsenite/antimonite-responsive transcriptional repressor
MAASIEPEAGLAESVFESAVRAAALLAAAADPNRMAILRILASGKACVCELQEEIPVAPNLLSYHLKVLKDAGLISGQRRGRWVDYEIAEDALDRLRAAIPMPATAQPPPRATTRAARPRRTEG